MVSLCYGRQWDCKNLLEFQICIHCLHSNQCANSQANLTKFFENFGTNLGLLNTPSRSLMVSWICYWIPVNISLTKMYASKFKRMLKINREWKYTLWGVLRTLSNIWDKVFKSGLSKLCWRQPLKTSKGYHLKINDAAFMWK